MKIKKIIIQALLVPVFFGAIAHAETLYVSPESPVDGPGTNWATAFHVIQDGIDAALAGDTVLVTNGVYNTGRVFEGFASNRVAITTAITVESVNGPDETSIVGAGPIGSTAVRCAYVGQGAVLRGFTLTGGYTGTWPGSGAAEVASGAGALIVGGTVDDCILTDNHADLAAGGAVFASEGGGQIVNSVITNNTVSINGGGLFFEKAGSATNCLIADNSAGSGGGGGVYFWGGGALINCTVVENSSTGSGDGIFMNGTVGTIANTIVWDNDADNYNSTAGSWLNCCTLPAAGQNAVAEDPMLDADYQLLPGSPCINAGTNQAWMTTATDLAGNPRIFGESVDIGAFEFSEAAPAIPVVDVTNTNTSVASSIETYTVEGTNTSTVIGSLVWTNAANAATGSVAVSGTAFSIPGILLAFNDNVITVTGTNALGEAASDAVTITRIGAPVLDITDSDAAVSIETYTVEGTNTSAVIGSLVWTNAANAATGSVAVSGTAFSIPGILLALNDNIITVTGTNALGEAASDTVTITRIGAPMLDITDSDATVSGSVATNSASGSNNVWIVGSLAWTNAANAETGSVVAMGTTFTITGIPLAFNDNLITVSGTNVLGETASDSLTITRSTESDTDGDGASDYNEYIADTDMFNSNDWFRVNAYSNSAVFFQSSSNRAYTLLYSTNLIEGVWTNVPDQTAVPGIGGMDSLSTTQTNDAGFYQVEVQMLPPEIPQ